MVCYVRDLLRNSAQEVLLQAVVSGQSIHGLINKDLCTGDDNKVNNSYFKDL